MNKKTKILKVLVIFMLIITLTGCTQTLKDKDGKVVQNEETGQTITENIICKPTDKDVLKIYEKNKVDIKDLPDCDDMKIVGKYENLWNTFFVRPLAFFIIKIGSLVGSPALSIVIITLIIRFALFPMTRKTLLQSENMKKAQPEINRIEKKYEGKTDNESMAKKGQEMMLVYKKYEINPLSGCLFAFIQLPILLAFWEAINRVPAIFEGTFIGLNMGTTPGSAMAAGDWYYIFVCVILIAATYFSYKLNPSMASNEQMEKQQKLMTRIMTVFIGFISFTLPTAISFYWVTSSLFTIFQNFTLKRSGKNE